MAEMKDEIGNVYDYLTVIARAGTKDKYATWWCKCQCGNIVEVKGVNLRRKGTKSCGCLQKQKVEELNKNKLIDLTGEKFGRLTVLKRGKNKKIQPTWICQCECGTIVEVCGGNLRKDGGQISCGCINSRGEFKIAQILSENKIDFQKEFKFQDCRSYTGHQLRFDFCILKNNKVEYLIEYQGEQHYKENSFMDHDGFYSRQIRDRIKRKYCKHNNIPLIIIPYTHFDSINIDDLLLEKTKFLYKGEIEKMKTLIVVDCQNDFISGVLGTKEAQAIVPNVKKKIEEYKARGDNIIFTRDTHYDNYLETNEGKNLPVKHCISGTYGWCIHDDLDEVDCLHIDKESFGYNSWDLWIDWDTESIEIVGLCSDICVVSNTLILKATFPEIDITVDASCCAGVTPESHKAALETMRMCQIKVIGE